MKHVLIRLATVLALAVPAWTAAAPSDTTRYGSRILGHDLLLHPAQPCGFSEVFLYVRGFEATACDSFLGVVQVPFGPLTIRTLTRTDVYCFTGPTQFFAVPVRLGPLAPGFHSVEVRREHLWLSANGTIDSTAIDSTYTFEVTSDCPELPILPAAELSLVDRAFTSPEPPCDTRPVDLVLAGHFNDGCGRVLETTLVDPGHVRLSLAPVPPVPMACTAALKPWRASFALRHLALGPHAVDIDLTIRGSEGFWPPIPDRRERGRFEFSVETSCDSLNLPYVRDVGFLRPCGLPICPGDSIRVVLTGQVPGFCCANTRVELHESPIAGPLPEPPIVRVVVDHDVQVRCACSPERVPWSAIVSLPPLPTRDYRLIVEVLERGGGMDSTLASDSVPFTVAPAYECVPFQACMRPGWVKGPGGCDAFVSKLSAAELTFTIAPPLPLAAVQGRIHVIDPGLIITGVEAVGPAAGMRLEWKADAGGGAFVLFAANGAPIPAGAASPILRLRLALPIRDENTTGGVYRVGALDLLGSDAHGGAVYTCLPLPCVDLRIAPDEIARVCLESPCDFNADGGSDVRDLVLMVRCLNDQEGCPPDSSAADCDGNGDFTMSDVICCARHLLRTLGCPECPVDSVRAEPTVSVGLGVPLPTADRIVIPLLIEGADRIGGLSFGLRFPADRFTASVTGFGQFLTMSEVIGDRLSVGLLGGFPVIGLGPGNGVSLWDGPPALHLTYKSGAAAGGEVRIEALQVSGPDGVLLDITAGPQSVGLDGGGGLQLAAPRPNPFEDATHFTVTFAAPSQLEVTVHDLSGRRVARLFRGSREAGVHEFRWDGRSDDGAQAPSGAYFLRAVTGEGARTRKLVLLRGPGRRTTQ